MIGIDPSYLLILLGWSIFAPFAALFIGWFARGEESK